MVKIWTSFQVPQHSGVYAEEVLVGFATAAAPASHDASHATRMEKLIVAE